MSFPSNQSGFTLIEMLTVIAIFTMMTAILLANLPQFRDQSSLELIAQQIAINVRTAQVFGIGTRGASGQFATWYGVQFAGPDPSNIATQNHFFLFADKNRNGVYDDADTIEYEYPISGGYGIVAICNGDSTEACAQDDIVKPGETIAVIFRRPRTEASFCLDDDTKNECAGPAGSNWNIFIPNIVLEIGKLPDAASGKKRLSIWQNGQINVVPGIDRGGVTTP